MNMGSNSSQPENVAQQRTHVEEQKWTTSFPRTTDIPPYRPKVLLHRDFYQKLRSTNNGEILQSGGTLTGRYRRNGFLCKNENEEVFDSSSNTYHVDTTRSRSDNFSTQKNKLFKNNGRKPGEPEHKKYSNIFHHQPYKKQVQHFSSEPNLHKQNSSIIEWKEIKEKWRPKKRYAAPAVPVTLNENFADQCIESRNTSQTRKTRLYKTRAEMKKRKSSQLDSDKNINNKVQSKAVQSRFTQGRDTYEIKYPTSDIDSGQYRDNYNTKDAQLNPVGIAKIRRAYSMPEFQQELKEATERLRHSRITDNVQKAIFSEKLKTLDHDVTGNDEIKYNIRKMNQEVNRRLTTSNDVPDSPKTPSKSSATWLQHKNQQKTEMFYFGMNDSIEINKTQSDSKNIVPTSASNLQTFINSSESDLSSDTELECILKNNGITLQLRPILPKKQLEIPRFSPTAAWRMLSSVESNTATSTAASDDGLYFIEDQIEKRSRPPPPTVQAGPRSNNDKSGDSGISGDAGPVAFEDTSETVVINQSSGLQIHSSSNKPRGMSWTPQQDLGDDSSGDENISAHNYTVKSGTVIIPPGSHVFCLSLPKEHHWDVGDKLSLEASTGLERIKKSVSGVLDSLLDRKDWAQKFPIKPENNWFLSRSAPNSLNSNINTMEADPTQKSDLGESAALFPANKKHSAGRLVYLPELINARHNKLGMGSKKLREDENMYKSRSYENISGELHTFSEHSNLYNSPRAKVEKCTTQGSKKFTFQSTMRQIEKRKLAEKLSREAERKELQRLRELEVMQRVEEEFQKKRAREKASIRQQLRLFSSENFGLSPNLNNKENHFSRSEPQGAASPPASSPVLLASAAASKCILGNRKNVDMNKYETSSSSSNDNVVNAPATQILSEYKQPHREYKDYRGRFSIANESDHVVRQATVHPQVTCNMPKVTRYQDLHNGSSNYNRNAHFSKNNKQLGSTYLEEVQNHASNSYPTVYQSYTPVTKF